MKLLKMKMNKKDNKKYYEIKIKFLYQNCLRFRNSI